VDYQIVLEVVYNSQATLLWFYLDSLVDFHNNCPVGCILGQDLTAAEKLGQYFNVY